MGAFGAGPFGAGAFGVGGPLTYAGEVEVDSPLAYYRLNEASGVSTISDSSGHGNHAAWVYGPTQAVSGLLVGDSDKAVLFSVDSYGDITYASWLDALEVAFTYEAVITVASTSGDYEILDRDPETRGRHFQWRVSGGKLQLILWTGTSGPVFATGATTLPTNTALHVAATWDGTTAKVWVNGVEDGSVAISGPPYSSDTDKNIALRIGAHLSMGVSSYRGVLDEIAIYGYALSGARLLAHYHAALNPSVASALNISVGIATETDTGLTIDPSITAAPLSIAVDIATEADTAQVVGVTVAAPPAAASIAVATALETDTALDVGIVIPQPLAIPVGIAPEADTALGVTVVVPLFIAVGIASETHTALAVEMDDGTEPTVVFLGKVVEVEEALTLDPIVQRIAALAFAEETEVALSLSPQLFGTGIGVDTGTELVVKLGIAMEREQSLRLRDNLGVQSATVGLIQTGVWIGPAGSSALATNLRLDVLERDLLQAPTSVLVAVVGAIPNRMMHFAIDGVNVYSELMPNGQGEGLFSVPVPEALGRRGEHVISVDQAGAVSASSIFSLRYDPDLLPTDRGPDTPPVEIPESIHPSGVRRWVLQDLMPGGLGSYVMPLNPEEMDNPAYERVLAATHTTAVNEGRVHITEGAVRPLDWSFKGYCPTEEMAETLRAYAELKRRFYIHDHRGRAWIVVITGAEIVPRLQQRNIYGELTDWVHDYTVNAVIFDRAEFA